jgi:TonB family protein
MSQPNGATTMKNTLLAACVAAALATPAHAGNELQLQFQRWSYEGGYARLQVSMANNTMKPFARVVWTCDLYNKQKHLVGETYITFNVVPWGVIVTNTQSVLTSDQFQDGECKLVETEPVTERNAWLYDSQSGTVITGNGAPEATRFFNHDYRIQGRAKVVSDEENDALLELQKAGTLTSLLGYKLECTPLMKCRFGISVEGQKRRHWLSAQPEDETNEWKKAVVSQIRGRQQYPADAPLQGGTVKIKFEIDRTGNIKSAVVETSSGSDVLDHAALEQLRTASPLPTPPTSVAGETISLIVPVKFAKK